MRPRRLDTTALFKLFLPNFWWYSWLLRMTMCLPGVIEYLWSPQKSLIEQSYRCIANDYDCLQRLSLPHSSLQLILKMINPDGKGLNQEYLLTKKLLIRPLFYRTLLIKRTTMQQDNPQTLALPVWISILCLRGIPHLMIRNPATRSISAYSITIGLVLSRAYNCRAEKRSAISEHRHP